MLNLKDAKAFPFTIDQLKRPADYKTIMSMLMLNSGVRTKALFATKGKKQTKTVPKILAKLLIPVLTSRF